MYQQKTIPLHLYPMGLIEVFHKRNIPLEKLLHRTRINTNMMRYSDTTISGKQLSQIILNGLSCSTEKNAGFHAGFDIDWNYFGPYSSIAMCAPSLKDAFELYFYMQSIFNPNITEYHYGKCFYFDKGKRLTVLVDSLCHRHKNQYVDNFEFEYTLAFLIRLSLSCGNPGAKNRKISVSLPPSRRNIQLETLSIPYLEVDYDAEFATLSTDIEYTTAHWRSLRSVAFATAREQCFDILREHRKMPLKDEVGLHIHEVFFNEAPTQEIIAKKMGMTPRSLARRLSDDATTFRHILHENKMEMVATHLAHSTLSIDTIARLLRFSNAASLRRAVKNWEEDASLEKYAEVHH